LNESHHFLGKLSCESVCEDLDAIFVSARSAVCFFSANIAVEQGVIVAVIVIAFFIFIRFWCTPTHVQAESSSDFDFRSRSTKLARMQTWLLSNSRV